MCTICFTDVAMLPEEKRVLIRAIAQWACRIEKTRGGKNAQWSFTFDEGVSHGHTSITLAQRDITPCKVLAMLDTVGWPGFKHLVAEGNALLLRMFTQTMDVDHS